MEEEYTYSEPTVKLLEEDLHDVDTSMPVLRKGLHDFQIADIEVAPNKDNTGENLRITLKTTSDLRSTKDEVVNQGWPVFKYIGLTPMVGRPGKKDYTEADIKKALAQFVLAATGEKSKIAPISRFKGMTVRCKVGIGKATDEFPESNTVTFIQP